MSTVSLPNDPNLEQLRKRARGLQRSVRAGDVVALELGRAITLTARRGTANDFR